MACHTKKKRCILYLQQTSLTTVKLYGYSSPGNSTEDRPHKTTQMEFILSSTGWPLLECDNWIASFMKILLWVEEIGLVQPEFAIFGFAIRRIFSYTEKGPKRSGSV